MSAFPQNSCRVPLSLFVFLSLSPSFPSLHCGSANCSYSNIPSLPSPQMNYSQPLSWGIINLLVLSTCKSQTIEPYGTILGCVVLPFGDITEPPSLSHHQTVGTLLRVSVPALSRSSLLSSTAKDLKTSLQSKNFSHFYSQLIDLNFTICIF